VEFKIESELFALVKSITNLNSKYQRGIVNDNFFRKALKSAMINFLKINFTMKEKHLHLPNLLKRMNLSEEYNSVLELINRVSTLDFSNNQRTTKNYTFLELPGITSEITSSFITLMDALTLEGMTKKELIFNLFDELTHNIGNFPGLDEISYKIKHLQKDVLNQIERLTTDTKLREELIDNLYQTFKEFQNKLNLKP
jgi:hypothetical protein